MHVTQVRFDLICESYNPASEFWEYIFDPPRRIAKIRGLQSLTAPLRMEPAAQFRDCDLRDRVAALQDEVDRRTVLFAFR
jgi:hypothetical protein